MYKCLVPRETLAFFCLLCSVKCLIFPNDMMYFYSSFSNPNNHVIIPGCLAHPEDDMASGMLQALATLKQKVTCRQKHQACQKHGALDNQTVYLVYYTRSTCTCMHACTDACIHICTRICLCFRTICRT